MRDLTKAITSYTWALSVFGAQQAIGLLGLGGAGSWNRNARALDHVTEATSNELGETMRAVFRAGDAVQRGVVDLLLAPVSAGLWPCGGSNGTPRNDSVRQAGAWGRQQDWTETAAGAARAGANMVGNAVDAGARGVRAAAEAVSGPTAPAPPAPPSADPSLGWGPMPR
jgi:hypothetical protein